MEPPLAWAARRMKGRSLCRRWRVEPRNATEPNQLSFQSEHPGSRGRKLCRKEMVTKPGLAGNGGARFSDGSALANCERRWRPNNKCRVSVKDEPTAGC